MLESGAMTQWLVDKYGSGRLAVAKGTKEHAMYCQVRGACLGAERVYWYPEALHTYITFRVLT